MTLYGDSTVPTISHRTNNVTQELRGEGVTGGSSVAVAFTRHDCRARHLCDGGRGYNEEEARRPWRPADGG